MAQFLRKRIAYPYEVEFTPGRRLVMRTAEGLFPMETTYTWEPVDEKRTRMTLPNRGTPQGFSKLMAPFMRLAVGRANRKDLALLMQLLETDAG